jgi:hypothetical protein
MKDATKTYPLYFGVGRIRAHVVNRSSRLNRHSGDDPIYQSLGTKEEKRA